MTMDSNQSNELIARLNVETDIERHQTAAVATINRAEVEVQIDAAHRWPRSIKRFLSNAISMATLTEEVAASCIYTLPRGGKSITGPSVRLAEIAASAYSNLQIGARVLDAEDTVVVAQGVAWDTEANVRVTVEVRRRILKKDGKRFDDDMINVTGSAAASIALRNSIFRVVPRAYIDMIYAQARSVAVGDAKTLSARRDSMLAHFAKLGVAKEDVLARVSKPSAEDVTIDDLETLVGIATAIKGGETIESHFAAVPKESATVKDLEQKLKATREKPAKKEPVPIEPMSAAQNGTESATISGIAPPPFVEGQPLPSVGSVTVQPAHILCAVCSLPVTGGGLSTRTSDGVIGIRHEACSPFMGGK